MIFYLLPILNLKNICIKIKRKKITYYKETNMDYTIDYILKKGSSEKMPSSSLDSISKAYKFALNYLEDETDKYHGKAITHPLNVAGIVADLNADVTTIIASLLHSTI